MSHNDIHLGDEVRHRLFDETGIVVGIVHHISGCDRFAVLPSDGSIGDEREYFFAEELTRTDDSFEVSDEPVTECDVELGNVVRDEITDTEGYVATLAYRLLNCPRISVKPIERDDDGEIDIVGTDPEWFDVPTVEVVDDGITADFDDLRDNDSEAETGALGDDLVTKPDMG